MAAADVEEIRASSYVGFDSITQQIEHKLLKRGFQFNVILVGEYNRVEFTACRKFNIMSQVKLAWENPR